MILKYTLIPCIALTMALVCAHAAPSANRQSGPVSIAQFGAAGDGKADDTMALRKSLASGSKDIYIPAGTYRIGGKSIDIPAGVTIRGAGKASTIKVITGTGTLFRVGKDCSFRQFSLDCAGAKQGGVSDGLLVVPGGAHGVTVESVDFTNSRRICVMSDHADYLTVRQCSFRSIYMAVHLMFSSNARVSDNTIEKVEHSAIRWWGNWQFKQKLMSNLIITGNCIKDNGAYEKLKDYSGGAISGTGAVRVVMANNIVDGAMDVGLDLEWCDDSVITGNTVRNCQNAGIALYYGCKRVSITGNTVVNDYEFKSPPESFWIRAGIWLAFPNRKEYPDDHGHHDISITGNTITSIGDHRRSLWIGEESDNLTITGNTISGGQIYDDRKPNLR